MLSTQESLHLEVYTKPTLRFAENAAAIGYAAWHDRFPRRSEAEIRHVFNPDSPERLYDSMCQARRKAGKFVGALAVVGDGESVGAAGFLWAAHDVTGRHAVHRYSKAAMLTIRGIRPWVWVAQANVRPQYQGKGIGLALLDQVLAGFAGDQRTSSYVFEENPQTLRWFEGIGYVRNDGPGISRPYFGEETEPVVQQRLHSRVAEVRKAIALKVPQDLVDGVTPGS